jgi:DNA-binding GntR family transcriptional regulator
MRTIRPESSLTKQVYDSIRASIIRGELAPGSLHSVQELADVLGVSRTPVREALIDLSTQGMVRFERNRGVRILQTSLHDLEEIFALRLLLEAPAAYVAAEQITDPALRSLRKEFTAMERAAEDDDEQTLMDHDRKFHGIILEASGNRRLASTVDRLRDLVLVRGVSTAGRSRSLSSIVDEHREILGSIERREAAASARALREHILHTAELLLSQEHDSGGGSGASRWADLMRFD